MKANSAAARQEAEDGLVLAAISHDLRTPVTSMIALAQSALEAERQGQEVGNCLEQILAAARTLEAITGDLTAAGTKKTREERISIERLGQALQAVAGPKAKAKKQRLRINLKALGEGFFIGDRAGIGRVLLNLLTNAIKYTPQGGKISLTASVEPDATPEKMTAVFSVEDNGIGMKPEFLARLYQPYARAPETSAIPGSGLGLTIARRLVTRMGGSMDVRSRWGEGSCFTVRLPLRRDAAPAKEAPAWTESALAGQRILLAEDNALCAQIAVRLLERAGAKVSRVENGQAAVKRFAASAPGTYSAILLDMNMPVLGGCGAAKAIRAMKRSDAAKIPIVALTAGTAQEDARNAEKAGMNGCLKKPMNVGELARVICPEREEGLALRNTI